LSNRAVFLDRDNTLIEDPGYLSDPGAVKLLPGAELAVKSLSQAGYKVVVVTNQSGIARGLMTEESLEKIDAEMERQLAEKSAHLDAIYYCPFHPEGTVEAYAKDSDLRKPRPGMLLKAAHELDIDLLSSWMIGDSPRDIEAGQRAGCRTVRVRLPEHPPLTGEQEDEDVEADFTVRNLVEAARIILREDGKPARSARQPAATPAAPAPATQGPAEDETTDMEDEPAPPPEPDLEPEPRAQPPVEQKTPEPSVPPQEDREAPVQAPQAPPEEPPAEEPEDRSAQAQEPAFDERRIQLELLQALQTLTAQRRPQQFSFTRLIASVCQGLAILTLAAALANRIMYKVAVDETIMWVLVSIVLQVMAATFRIIRRNP
jgi:D-glycero-D-manno-heptose 1,7-bisphosphate phosphatase